MNKAELIDVLTEKLGTDRRTATDAVEHIVDTIVRAVHKGQSVTITGFGVFEQRKRAARVARNPRTGETVKVKPTSVPAFRPGAQFKAVIAGKQKLPADRSGGQARFRLRGSAAKKTAAKKTAAKKTTAKAAAKKTAATKAPAKTTAAKKTDRGQEDRRHQGSREEDHDGKEDHRHQGHGQDHGGEEDRRQKGSRQARHQALSAVTTGVLAVRRLMLPP